MIDPWLVGTITLAAVVSIVAWRLQQRRPQEPPASLDPREARLARELARMADCSMEQALPAVQREIEIAPGQSDAVLLKRAAYHYRQELPEPTCQVYRDAAPG